jgi:uncharacterized membrane protein YqjE
MHRPWPSWLKVLAIALGVVLAVGLVALVALLVPPFGEAVRQAPVVVIVLVVGTVAVLWTTIRATMRR